MQKKTKEKLERWREEGNLLKIPVLDQTGNQVSLVEGLPHPRRSLLPPAPAGPGIGKKDH